MRWLRPPTLPINLGDTIPDTWDVLSPSSAKAFTTEMRREVGPQHPLYAKRYALTVLAAADGNDDVLLWDRSEPEQFYIMHLTWRGKPDFKPDIFPTAIAVEAADLKKALAPED